MTHKEKIIKILNQYIVTENNTCYCNSDAEGIADEILALPLDVPDSDFLLDILLKVNEYVRQENQFIATEYVGVFKEWMRDEMIKRNTKK